MITPQHYWDPQQGWVAIQAPSPQLHTPEVTGGGTYTPTFTPDDVGSSRQHMRWGRLFAVIVAVGFVALAVANLLDTGDSRNTQRSITSNVAADDGLTQLSDSPADTSTVVDSATPQRARAVRSQPRMSPTRTSINAQRGRVVARGSGTSTAQGLPYTGAPAWIAAVLGILMLAGGIVIQLRAVEIGDTASQYRRGPLLRPLELMARVPIVYCRLAQWAGMRSFQELRERWELFLERITETPDPYVPTRR